MSGHREPRGRSRCTDGNGVVDDEGVGPTTPPLESGARRRLVGLRVRVPALAVLLIDRDHPDQPDPLRTRRRWWSSPAPRSGSTRHPDPAGQIKHVRLSHPEAARAAGRCPSPPLTVSAPQPPKSVSLYVRHFELVVALAAADPIVVVAARDRVVARAAVDAVIGTAAERVSSRLRRRPGLAGVAACIVVALARPDHVRSSLPAAIVSLPANARIRSAFGVPVRVSSPAVPRTTPAPATAAVSEQLRAPPASTRS